MPSSTKCLTNSLIPMTLTAKLTKSQICKSLVSKQRAAVASLIAQRWLDSMDDSSLAQFFIDVQTEYLQEWSDPELVTELGDNFDEDELEEEFETF